jgi:hypothetical protein
VGTGDSPVQTGQERINKLGAIPVRYAALLPFTSTPAHFSSSVSVEA